MMKAYEAYNNTIELKGLVKELFEEYLDVVEYKLIKSILTDINAVKDELIKLNAEKEHK